MSEAGYPTIGDVDAALAQLIGAVPEDRWPAGMPLGPRDAARWLRENVLEGPQTEEAPYRHKKSEGWAWPYLNRCLVHARMFVTMPHQHQSYIVAAREDGVVWRGEVFEVFQRVYDEAMRMREIGADAYRKEAIGKLRGMAKEKAA